MPRKPRRDGGPKPTSHRRQPLRTWAFHGIYFDPRMDKLMLAAQEAGLPLWRQVNMAMVPFLESLGENRLAPAIMEEFGVERSLARAAAEAVRAAREVPPKEDA